MQTRQKGHVDRRTEKACGINQRANNGEVINYHVFSQGEVEGGREGFEFPVVPTQYRRLQGKGEVLSLSILTPSLVGKEGQCGVPILVGRTLKPREEKRPVKVIQHICDRGGLKTDFLTSGQVLSSPDSSTSPANLHGEQAGQSGKAIGPVAPWCFIG